VASFWATFDTGCLLPASFLSDDARPEGPAIEPMMERSLQRSVQEALQNQGMRGDFNA
jgi:hypothetical protein